MEAQKNTYDTLSAKWKERFEFFDKYGAPGSVEYKAALKQLPFKKKILINGNLIAFFGLIYFFVLGLWKKNLTLIGVGILVGVILGIIELIIGRDLPRGMDTGLNVAFMIVYMQTVNYAYYLKITQGKQSWNPFEGWKSYT